MGSLELEIKELGRLQKRRARLNSNLSKLNTNISEQEEVVRERVTKLGVDSSFSY